MGYPKKAWRIPISPRPSVTLPYVFLDEHENYYSYTVTACYYKKLIPYPIQLEIHNGYMTE